MANLKFYGSLTSDTESHTLECEANGSQIYINIDIDSHNFGFLTLDIPTAIAFRKHLAQQIAVAKEEYSKEVDNG